MNETKEFFLRCSCHDPRCLVWFWFDEDTFGVNLNSGDVGLWRRIKSAFMYVFAQRKFWYYGDICLILDEVNRKEINRLISFLEAAARDPNRDKLPEGAPGKG